MGNLERNVVFWVVIYIDKSFKLGTFCITTNERTLQARKIALVYGVATNGPRATLVKGRGTRK